MRSCRRPRLRFREIQEDGAGVEKLWDASEHVSRAWQEQTNALAAPLSIELPRVPRRANRLVQARRGLPSRTPRTGRVSPLSRIRSLYIGAQSPLRQVLPYPRHPDEMRLQSRIRNLARELHTV